MIPTRPFLMSKPNVYAAIIEEIFQSKFKKGMTQVDFERPDITAAADRRGVPRPSNVGDVVYSARYRGSIPESVQSTATRGREWIIRGTGPGRYSFVLTRLIRLAPNEQMGATKVPDATPGIVAMHALNDEQALLAVVRYGQRRSEHTYGDPGFDSTRFPARRSTPVAALPSTNRCEKRTGRPMPRNRSAESCR